MMYGVAPSEYRREPKPVVLRTRISSFDRYFLGLGEIGMVKSSDDIKTYFVTIPAHKFLYIKTIRVMAIGIFGRSKVRFPDRIVIRSAAYWTVSKEN